MIGYRTKQMQQRFFTAANVIASVDKTTRRALSMFGAFVRTTAKQSIKRRKQASDPGSPPSAHLGLIGRFLYFALASGNRSVVIGPALLNSSYSSEGSLGALERGGDTTLFYRAWVTRSGQARIERKQRTIHIKARPFMQPAFDKELPGLSRIWDKARR